VTVSHESRMIWMGMKGWIVAMILMACINNAVRADSASVLGNQEVSDSDVEADMAGIDNDFMMKNRQLDEQLNKLRAKEDDEDEIDLMSSVSIEEAIHKDLKELKDLKEKLEKLDFAQEKAIDEIFLDTANQTDFMKDEIQDNGEKRSETLVLVVMKNQTDIGMNSTKHNGTMETNKQRNETISKELDKDAPQKVVMNVTLPEIVRVNVTNVTSLVNVTLTRSETIYLNETSNSTKRNETFVSEKDIDIGNNKTRVAIGKLDSKHSTLQNASAKREGVINQTKPSLTNFENVRKLKMLLGPSVASRLSFANRTKFKIVDRMHKQHKNIPTPRKTFGKSTTASTTKTSSITSTRNSTFHSSSNHQFAHINGDHQPNRSHIWMLPNSSDDASSSKKSGVKMKEKAELLMKKLDEDPLKIWQYHYTTLDELGISTAQLKRGLVNPGNTDRLKEAMTKALSGSDITASIVGGSISAGGGLYKDRGNIDGLYYKGVLSWWNKIVKPVTGSQLHINNAAIGSIGSDYFASCATSHIAKDTNIVFWELAANDFNRYVNTPSNGARILEQFTRTVLELPKSPALVFLNFFKGIDYKNAHGNACPDFEDQGEEAITKYYKIPSLSWRDMVCKELRDRSASTSKASMSELFSNDEYHPSLRGHAQMTLLILLHLRHVLREVLKKTIKNRQLPKAQPIPSIPQAIYYEKGAHTPLCWTLISPDERLPIDNSLKVNVSKHQDFEVTYATNFPIRFDKVICWKAVKPGAKLAVQFTIPHDYMKGEGSKVLNKPQVLITSHTRFGGAAYVWLDHNSEEDLFTEGRPNDPGKRTQVDLIKKSVLPGNHTLHVEALRTGFCLSAIMVEPG